MLLAVNDKSCMGRIRDDFGFAYVSCFSPVAQLQLGKNTGVKKSKSALWVTFFLSGSASIYPAENSIDLITTGTTLAGRTRLPMST